MYVAIAAGKQPEAKRREPLTRERILDAAMRIIENEGLDALSMRRIGKELHVRDMALYHHFERKDEILTGLVRRMFEAFDAVRPQDVNWREYMVEVMQAMAQMLGKVGIKAKVEVWEQSIYTTKWRKRELLGS